MLSKWQWLFTRLKRTLWLHATLVCFLGVIVALVALPIQTLVDEPLPFTIGSDAVGDILNILATSMLTVTIFSLSVMVTAYSAASSGVTPRAIELVKQDATTQKALASFLGSFLFSLVGIIALSTGVYTEVGRFVLFIATLTVIVWILLTLLRWIEHLSGLGRVGHTASQVEEKARAALQERISYPALGGKPMHDSELPADARPVLADSIGYVQHVDMEALSAVCSEAGLQMGVLALAGTLVHPQKTLAWYRGRTEDAVVRRICRAFTVGEERSFDQDPRFGFTVLSEIASKALSPAVNDPGTAIDILNRALRLLSVFCDQPENEPAEILYTDLEVVRISMDDLFDDIFLPIARDGAGLLEVQLRLQKTLLALKQINGHLFAGEARRCSRLALQFAENSLLLECDKQRLHEVAQQIEKSDSR